MIRIIMNLEKKIIINNIKKIQINTDQLNSEKIIKSTIQAVKLIVNALKNKNKILFCGNGGSAADAQHLSAELLGRYLKNRKPLASIDLNSNTSAITAISNDISYNEVFSRQLAALGNKGDILFAITTSGKSKNILKALNISKKKKYKNNTFSF